MNIFRRNFKPSTQSANVGRSRFLKPPFVVNPLRRHEATIILLHGTGQEGFSFSGITDSLSIVSRTVKWICPTGSIILPSRGFAWFDADGFSENANDIEGLDASAAYIASLLANEPRDVKIGVGGFCMGAALAMYCATCFAGGKYGNSNPFTANLNVVFGISGWLTCSENLRRKLDVAGGAERAASLPMLLCHGTGDDVVPHRLSLQAAEKLTTCGFRNLAFKSCATSVHDAVTEEWSDICCWLISNLGVEGH